MEKTHVKDLLFGLWTVRIWWKCPSWCLQRSWECVQMSCFVWPTVKKPNILHLVTNKTKKSNKSSWLKCWNFLDFLSIDKSLNEALSSACSQVKFPMKTLFKSIINPKHLILAPFLVCQWTHYSRSKVALPLWLQEKICQRILTKCDTDSCLVFVLCFNSKPENGSHL